MEGGTPTRENFLPFVKPLIEKEEIEAVNNVLKSGWLTTGPKTKEFEKNFREYVGSNEAIGLSSCTAALHISLLTLGIKEGDEVITSTFTFVSTAHAIKYVRAIPILVDIEKDTFNINHNLIEEKITDKTKAIIVVHFGGHPCNMDKIIEIAKKYNLFIIEDAAHAIGASYKNKMIGNIGDITCFSFYANKNITTGEGGMLTTNNPEIANKARLLSYLGMEKDAWKRYSEEAAWFYRITDLGYKYNLSDILSSIGIEQLKKLNEINKKRREYTNYYTEKLEELEELTLPTEKEGVKSSWHLYPIIIKKDKLKINRDQFIRALNKENIGTAVHFIPLHKHLYYKQFIKEAFPIANWVFERILSLPLFPQMTKNDLDDVIMAIKKIIKYYKK